MSYVMKENTMVILPKYNSFGQLITVVAEYGKVEEVEMKPIDFIDGTLRYFGSSLRGAKDGAKELLGKVSRPPIMVSEELDLYLVPSAAHKSDRCIWFVLKYIVDCDVDENGNTVVMLLDGSRVEVDISKQRMNDRINQAHALKGRKQNRSKFYYFLPTIHKPFLVKQNNYQLNFEVDFM